MFLKVLLLILVAQLSFSKNWDVEFGGRSNVLNSTVGDVDGNRFWLEFDGQYSSLPKKGFGYHGDLYVQRNDTGLISGSLREAYLRYKNGNGTLFVGRKIHAWSFTDSYWGIGTTNNRENIDFYRPGQEGLTGLSYQWNNKRFGFTAFASYINIPELNPNTDIDAENRTIGSRNPFGRNFPGTTTALNPGQVTPIFYDVEELDIASIVFNYSVGLSARVKGKNWLLKGFILRKPENTTSTSGRFIADVQENASSIEVSARAEVFYHTVLGGDLQYAVNRRTKLYASLLHIVPDEESQDGSNSGELEELSRLTSIQVGKKIQTYASVGGIHAARRYKLGLHYLARVSEFDVEGDSTVSFPRWSQAVSVDGEWLVGRRWRLKGNVKVDTIEQSRIFSVSVGYKYNANLRFVFGVDGIGADEENSFWSQFQNNDAVYVASYISF